MDAGSKRHEGSQQRRVGALGVLRVLPGDTILTVRWKPIDFVREGQKGELELVAEGVIISGEEQEEFKERTAVWIANFGPHGHSTYEFIIDYHDLIATPYRAAVKVDRGHTEILRDEAYTGG